MRNWLLDSMASRGDAVAVAGAAGRCTYAELLERVERWDRRLSDIDPSSVVAFDGDYGPGTIALMLSLMARRNLLLPLSLDVSAHHDSFAEVAQAEYWISRTEGDALITKTGATADHQLYVELRRRQAPGLLLFSSGSTGAHKCALHDLSRLLEKFRTPRHRFVTLVFLQLDHIGGVNTLLYSLANGGTAVTAHERSAAAVCQAIATHRVQLLPTSPTFLNLLLLSEEYRRHDLSSLKLITYGTEPMPESTLRRVVEAFPKAQLLQTYGLSELGILRSKSRSSDSLWVRVGGEGFETKVVDGRLCVRSHSAMLGYLNAPSPFDDDGFFDTGDLVDVDGEWVRFRGRKNEIINVGGSKVYPTEVESVLLELDNVIDATVAGERNPITGQIVTATVRLLEPEPSSSFKLRMRAFCARRLSAYKIPVRVNLTQAPLHSERFKRRRTTHHAIE